MKRQNKLLCFIILLVYSALQVNAQLTEEELAKIAQNPLANIISVPFQNNTSFGIGPFDRTQNILNIQPVVPFAEGKFIARVVIPILNQPNVFSETGSFSGLGDILLSAFYASKGEKVSWGAGPVFNIPTAKENLGIGEWGFGPSFVAVVKPSNWVIGALINNIWSLESDQSAFLLQPFINYNLPDGYYFSAAPSITANWKAATGEKWTIPVGLAFGKVIKPKGFLPFNLQAGAYYHIEKPEVTGSDWTFRVAITALIPKAIFHAKKKPEE